jgi:hypothetical protein
MIGCGDTGSNACAPYFLVSVRCQGIKPRAVVRDTAMAYSYADLTKRPGIIALLKE